MKGESAEFIDLVAMRVDKFYSSFTVCEADPLPWPVIADRLLSEIARLKRKLKNERARPGLQDVKG